MAGRTFKVSLIFDAVNKAGRKVSNLLGGTERLKADFKKVGIAAGLMGAAIVAAAVKAANAAGIQEKAERLLGEALSRTANVRGVTLEELKLHASALQKITTVGDETSLEVMRLGLSMGVSAGQIKEATKETIALSKAYGVDLKASMKMVALARAGEFSMLARYIPQLRTTTDKTKQLTIFNKAMADGFKIAEAETDTYAGKILQLGNEWGDLQEKVGFKVIPVFEELLKVVKDDIFPMLEDFTDNMGDGSGAALNVAKALQFMIRVGTGVVAIFDIMGSAGAGFVLAITGRFAAAKEAFSDMSERLSEWGTKLAEMGDMEIEITKNTETAKTEIHGQGLTDRGEAEDEAIEAADEKWLELSKSISSNMAVGFDAIMRKTREFSAFWEIITDAMFVTFTKKFADRIVQEWFVKTGIMKKQTELLEILWS